MPPRLSVVVLTWNEERNIAQCLTSLASQTTRDFDVLVIDAASTDHTASIVHGAIAAFPVPLRLEVAKTRIAIGEARNLGARLATADQVAYVSADAELEPNWVERALHALASCDMVFGRQAHAPQRWTVAAAVRGLRYRFPDVAPEDPAPYASNVACAYRRELLRRYPFDPWTNASEDVLLARRATAAGFQVQYEPSMVVRHHDVETLRQELRKNVREGHGNAVYRKELGTQWELLAWGGAIVAAAGVAVLRPAIGIPAMVGAIWAPTLRRAIGRRHGLPPRHLAKALAASPPFDLAYLANYARGMLSRAPEGGKPAAATQGEPDQGGLQGAQREPTA